jgi:hypothetical protein
MFYEGLNLGKFIGRKVPSAISDQEELNGLESCWRRSLFIFQGRKGDKSSGGLPLFSAQAVRYSRNQ